MSMLTVNPFCWNVKSKPETLFLSQTRPTKPHQLTANTDISIGLKNPVTEYMIQLIEMW